MLQEQEVNNTDAVAHTPETQQSPVKKKPNAAICIMSFSDTLEQIDKVRIRSDREYYKLLLAVLTAYQVGFGNDVSAQDALKHDAVLNTLVADRGIKGNSRVAKLCKLGITCDSKRVYPVIYVIEVAIALIQKGQITLAGFIKWVESQHGLQQIRLNYNRDGSAKISGKTDQQEIAEKLKERNEKALEAVLATEMHTLDASAMSPIAALGKPADGIAIISQLADGSFIIRATTDDPTAYRSAIAAIGRKSEKS